MITASAAVKLWKLVGCFTVNDFASAKKKKIRGVRKGRKRKVQEKHGFKTARNNRDTYWNIFSITNQSIIINHLPMVRRRTRFRHPLLG